MKDNLHRVFIGMRRLALGELKCCDTERPDIGLGIVSGLPSDDFGRLGRLSVPCRGGFLVLTIQKGVPTKVNRRLMALLSWLETPKSANLISPCSLMSTLAALMSRWILPIA